MKNINLPLKKGSTLFLKLVIIFMGLAVFGITGIALPYEMITNGIHNDLLFFVLLYLTCVPFYFALYQGMKLLGYIDKDTAFSMNSVKALDKIKYCAMVMTVLYVACLPWIFRAADEEDAPGMILMWMAVCGAPLVIAVFASLLQILLENVLDIKSENDLTV